MKILLTLSAAALSALSLVAARTNVLDSPDGQLRAIVTQQAQGLPVTLEILRDGSQLLAPSAVGLEMRDDKAPKLGKGKLLRDIHEHIDAVNYRQKAFDVTYNQLTMPLGNGLEMQLRAFNDGIAYRYLTPKAGVVTTEVADLRLPADLPVVMAYQPENDIPFRTAFQNTYSYDSISRAQPQRMAFPPAVVCYPSGVKMAITEADLNDYPGMFFIADTLNLGLRAAFPPYPTASELNSWRRQRYITSGEDFIAQFDGPRQLPWRLFVVATADTELPVINLVYALAEPSRLPDSSWIKPGKVQWDWWHDWNLRGVPFRAGINTDTYKYYIDFASAHGIPYVVLDEGWYKPSSGDMLTVVPDVDLEQLVAYGREKGVKLILWTVFDVLDQQLQDAVDKYSRMGIAGFKVDFLDRADQTAVQQAYRIAQACADAQLILDFHGFYPPSGLTRTFPNIVNVEAVFGMEEAKWTDIKKHDMPLYDVTFPYIRMMGGPVDFTPGAMRNASRADWRAVYSEPISQGTRAHQAASYVVVDSPLTMLADAPSAYALEPEYTDFIAALPDGYEQTLIPMGSMGEYIVSARRAPDGSWYIGAQTNWSPRDIILPLAFLPADTSFTATILADGPNADRNAMDYVLSTLSDITSGSSLPIHMAPGGGFVAVLKPVNQ